MKFLKGSWWYSYINLNTIFFYFFMKIPSLWPWPQGHPWGGDGANKNFRPISTIRPNMNEIHQKVFKIWGLINFNTKTLTLCDGKTNKQNERKSKNYMPSHTSCVGGIMMSAFQEILLINSSSILPSIILESRKIYITNLRWYSWILENVYNKPDETALIKEVFFTTMPYTWLHDVSGCNYQVVQISI